MSGHSKWSTIKRKKGAADAQRGKIFTKLIREITAAARTGGGDLDANTRLRTAVTAARSANMPSANIEKAIKRGTGEIEGITYEEACFEGYGPGGVALFIDVLTDNRNRTVSEIRHLLSKHHGSLGENGCVAWIFELKGVIAIPAESRSEEEMMELVLELGGEDFTREGAFYSVTTNPSNLNTVREALETRGVKIESAELMRVPQNTVPLKGKEAEQMLKLMEALEDQDDVQRVSANFDIPDELISVHGN
jgi:YebC/PmpR family DNA-binding regulatory protein